MVPAAVELVEPPVPAVACPPVPPVAELPPAAAPPVACPPVAGVPPVALVPPVAAGAPGRGGPAGRGGAAGCEDAPGRGAPARPGHRQAGRVVRARAAAQTRRSDRCCPPSPRGPRPNPRCSAPEPPRTSQCSARRSQQARCHLIARRRARRGWPCRALPRPGREPSSNPPVEMLHVLLVRGGGDPGCVGKAAPWKKDVAAATSEEADLGRTRRHLEERLLDCAVL